MKRKHYWGIATLIILLIGASVFLLLRNTDTEPIVVYNGDVEPSTGNRQSGKKLAETDKFTKWFEEKKDELVSDDSEVVKGKMPEGQENDKTLDWHSLTSEQQRAIFDQFYTQFGLKVPPRGYDYRWKEPGVPYLDENGNPVLHKIGEPIVDIQMKVGFAPTREEFERYNQLKDDRIQAEVRRNSAEVARLDREIKALEASVQRIRPVHVLTIWSTAEAKAKSTRVTTEKLNAALREHGLEHLISPWD
ncbi:hypothetical protein F4212_00925 [Candidatus Poribacteria bacterium]|nr:hypothetical protein [Candidatus Poribacteria bacterium]